MKAKRIIEANIMWKTIQPLLQNKDRKQLRNQLAQQVNGYGLKEASHFLRNIGKSDSQIAILDRHILKNLKARKIIQDDNISSPKKYYGLEQQFLQFSRKVNIPLDHLDLLWWSQENGELFK